MNRLPRSVINRMAITVAALYVALCAGAGVAGATITESPATPPLGGPLPPMPPPPPPSPGTLVVPALPAPQSPAPQPRPTVTDLAEAALPGTVGLLGLSGLGGLIGYRQAKAGFALRAAGTARFLS